YRLITHGQDTYPEPERLAEHCGNVGEALAGAPTLRPQEMRRQVTVAEMEPRPFPIALQHRQAIKGVAKDAPAALFVHQPAQGIAHDIQIRRYVKAVELDLITSIAQAGYVFGWHHGDKPTQ